MNQRKNETVSDRLSSAAKAREAMLERFRSRPGPDDPAVKERLEAQKAIIAARDARNAERRAAQEREAARIATEKLELKKQQEREAAEEVIRQARKAAEIASADADYKARALALAAKQKAARDARYAARKAR